GAEPGARRAEQLELARDGLGEAAVERRTRHRSLDAGAGEIELEAGDPASHLPVAAGLEAADEAARVEGTEQRGVRNLGAEDLVAARVAAPAVAGMAAEVITAPAPGPGSGRRLHRHRCGCCDLLLAELVAHAGAHHVDRQVVGGDAGAIAEDGAVAK